LQATDFPKKYYQERPAMNLKIFTNKDVTNKTVLVRTDYNVPLKKKGKSWQVVEAQRIQNSLPLIEELRKNKAKIILMSHLGRPKGEVKSDFSLKPIAEYLKKSCRLPVTFSEEVIGEKVNKMVSELKEGEILLLENLRFHSEEKKNDTAFAKKLASLADIYINEAFSASHRAHASIAAIGKYLPSFAGLHLQKEVEHLSKLMTNPVQPFVMVIGGAKISDKVEAVGNLHKVASVVLLGGGVANNFLKAEGIETHKSYLEEADKDNKISYLDLAGKLVTENRTEKILKDGYIPLPKLMTPIDVVAAPNKDSRKTQVINLSSGMKDTPDDEDLMYLDIGPRTAKLYADLLIQARTIFWNGPLGVFEKSQFSHGTQAVARAIASSDAESFIGGGDTIAAINKFGLAGRFSYISSAGGAALEFLAGKKLPGLEVIEK